MMHYEWCVPKKKPKAMKKGFMRCETEIKTAQQQVERVQKTAKIKVLSIFWLWHILSYDLCCQSAIWPVVVSLLYPPFCFVYHEPFRFVVESRTFTILNEQNVWNISYLESNIDHVWHSLSLFRSIHWIIFRWCFFLLHVYMLQNFWYINSHIWI